MKISLCFLVFLLKSFIKADSKYILIGNKSLYYYIESTSQTTWSDASTRCGTLGIDRLGVKGRLVAFESRAEMNLLHPHFKDISGSVWIGLRQRLSDRSFVWPDGRAPTFTNWGRGKPNPRNNELCVEMLANTMTWNDIHCDMKRHYICKIATDKLGDCGQYLKDWKRFRNMCYLVKASVKDAMDWISAEQYCVNRMAHLVSVMDKTEEEFVLRELLQESEAINGIWSGLKFIGNQTASNWTDGSPANYKLMIDEQPVNGSCVSFNSFLGKWRAVQCSRKLGIICKTAYRYFPYRPFTVDINKVSSVYLENLQRSVSKDSTRKIPVGRIAGITVTGIGALSSFLFFLVKRCRVQKTLSTSRFNQ